MNLKDLKDLPEEKPKAKSSGGTYPKYDEKIPTFAIWEEDGELVSGWNPENQLIVLRKKTKSAKWERYLIPEEIERWWMDKTQLKRTVSIIEDHYDVDGLKLLQEKPEEGLRLARNAAKKHSPKKPDWERESCPVCREKLHVRYDDYEIIDGRRVCSSHNVHDLKKAGLLD